MAKVSLEKYFVGLSKDSLIYGLGNAVLRVLALITAPIFTRIFIPAQYGVISLIASVLSFLSLLLIFGMDSAVFVSFYEYKKEQRRVISSGFWFLVCWSAVLSGLGIILSNKISFLVFKTDLYRVLFILVFTTAIFTLLTNYAKAIFRLEFRPKTFAFVSSLVAVLTTALMIIFVAGFHWGLVGYFSGSLIGATAGFLLALFLIRKDLEFRVSWPRLKEMVAYGSMLVPSSVAFYVLDLSDRFFVNHYRTLTELGLYSIAINITSMISFFSVALGQAWSPFILDIFFKSKKIFKEFIPRALNYYLIFFFALSVLVSTFGLEILKLLATPKFYGASRAIAPLALAMVFSATLQVTGLGISIKRKTQFFALYSAVAALLNIGLNFLLIPKYGMVGAGIATAISYLFLTASYYYKSQQLIWLVLDWQKTFKLVLLSLAAILIFPLSWHFSSVINIAVKIGEFLGYLLLIYLFGVIEKQELGYLKNTFWRRFRKKI